MHWLIWSVILAVVSYLVLFNKKRKKSTEEKLRTFKGPPGLPILGNALDFGRGKTEVLKIFSRWVDKYGRRFKFRLGSRTIVVIANAADAEKILSSTEHLEKSEDYRFLHRWLGLGLLNSTGDKWFHRRKQLTPAFHFSILEDFLRVFNEQCQVLERVLEKKVGQSPFDIFPVITRCTLDIICEAAMGRKVYAQEQADSEYVSAVYSMSELFQYRQMRPWLHPDFMWDISPRGKEETRTLKILHDFTNKVIQERKQDKREASERGEDSVPNPEDFTGGKKRLAFLDLLLDAQEKDACMTDINIREETDTFMFGGHDTTSAGVGWATFLLACHPEIQDKVQQELDSIFGDDRTRHVTVAGLTKMKYLEFCIKESQRIFPSSPFVGRIMAKDQLLDEHTVIPKGCTVFPHFYLLHRDPTVFPEPEKFDPDRFLPENVQGRHPYAYLPFSAGPRNCIGQRFAMMEEKVMLSSIFRNFRITAAMRQEEVEVLCELITRPNNGLNVTLEKR